jgi:hypothetical protein
MSGNPRSRNAKAALARLRAACLALPETTEKIAWGAPTFRVKDKLFAMFADDHHGDGRLAAWCHAPKGAQHVLVGSEPDLFFVPPYVGPRGWVGVHLGAIDDERLAEVLRDAYRMVAPKKLAASLGD